MPYLLAALGGLLLIAALIFAMRYLLSRLADRRIAAYQNDLTTRHYEEVQNIYRQMRGWRHDYHNHIQAMKAHLTLGQLGELVEYLGKLDEDLTLVDTLVKTGNVMVDAILNSKLSLAKAREIQINAKAFVPENLAISEVDLCVILGNLLDNAMESCSKIESEERFIRVYLGTLKGQFYLCITNSSGEVRREGLRFVSTKQQGSHGFGLMRVDRIVQKLGGFINRQYEEGVFATEVLLPL